MSTGRFVPGADFEWRGVRYVFRRLLADGVANIEDTSSEAFVSVALSSLVEALFQGELFFEVRQSVKKDNIGRGVVNTHQPEQHRVSNGPLELDDYPAHSVAIARYRLTIIQPLLALEVAQRTEDLVRERVREVQGILTATTKVHPTIASSLNLLEAGMSDPDSPVDDMERKKLTAKVSVASVYRWLNMYESVGGDIRALIPNSSKCGGPRKPRLNTKVDSVIQETIRENYPKRETVTIDEILQKVAARIEEINATLPQAEHLPVPSRPTIARRLKLFQETHYREVYTAKHGSVAARRAFSQYGEGERVTLPLERVEIDHTKADLILVDDEDGLPLGRPTFTLAIDAATRYPLGFYLGFEEASYYAVMECLYHAICPKPDIQKLYGTEHPWLAWGMPSRLVVDNGREFAGRDLADACASLGITLERTPVRMPHLKGIVERTFGTLNTMLFHTLPGTTFSNVFKRGDYNAIKVACVGLTDVDTILHTFFVDLFAERFHRGLGGVPARQWERAMEQGFMPALPTSITELQVLLGRTDYRAIHHYGIEFDTIRYNCRELAGLRIRLDGKKTKIKYHPGDLSRIHAYDPDEGRYIEAPSLATEYTRGLSLWKHKIILDFAHRYEDEVTLAALGRSRCRIEEIVRIAKERASERKRTHSRETRLNTGGKPISALHPKDGYTDGEAELIENRSPQEGMEEYESGVWPLQELAPETLDKLLTPGVVSNGAHDDNSMSEKQETIRLETLALEIWNGGSRRGIGDESEGPD
jgi:putative transposase